jgi:hypothetical protein
MISKPSVHIFFVNVGDMREELAWWRDRWITDERYEIATEGARHTPVASNRNRSVKRFLGGDADFMMMVDDDVVPTQDPLDLVRMNLDIVVFPTPVFKPGSVGDYPIHLNVELPAHPEGEGDRYVCTQPDPLMEISAGGTGCILIARRVLEHPDLKAPFMDRFDEDGVRVESEDTTFVRRAIAAGFKAWAAMEYRCSHVKEVDLLMVDYLYRKVMDKQAGDD